MLSLGKSLSKPGTLDRSASAAIKPLSPCSERQHRPANGDLKPVVLGSGIVGYVAPNSRTVDDSGRNVWLEREQRELSWFERVVHGAAQCGSRCRGPSGAAYPAFACAMHNHAELQSNLQLDRRTTRTLRSGPGQRFSLSTSGTMQDLSDSTGGVRDCPIALLYG